MSGIVGAVAIVLALGLGVLVGLVYRSDDPAVGLKPFGRALARAVVPVALLVCAVAILVGLVLLAKSADGHEDLWSQVVAAVSLLLITALLYGTGVRKRTASAPITQGAGESAIDIAQGEVIPQETYEQLTPGNKGKVHRQRGLYFRTLLVGADGRWSTSKLQPLLWTFVLLYGFITLFVLDQLTGGRTFSQLDFQEEYLLLLGGPFAAAVLAKGITATKVEHNEITKPQAPDDEAGPIDGLKDVISDDQGNADLVDFQYFAFNLVALAFVLIAFVPDPDIRSGFPDIPDFLIGLTSASALTYVAKKAIERSAPQITHVSPSRLFPGQPMTIRGRYLVSPSGRVPTVTVDGHAAEPTVENAGREAERHLKVDVPAGVEPGDDKEVAVFPDGAAAPATATIAVVQIAVTGVEPSPIPLKAKSTVVIDGTGFGQDKGTVELHQSALEVVQWSETKITATLASVPDTSALAAEQKVPLTVKRGDAHGHDATYLVSTSQLKPELTTVQPETVLLRPGASVVVDGKGFGQLAGSAAAKLGDVLLVVDSWNDDRLAGRLPDDLTATPSTRAADQLPLTLTAADGATASKQVPVRALEITEATPAPFSIAGGDLRVRGTGFLRSAAGPAQVTLDNQTLEISSWSEGLIVAKLPAGISLTAGTTAPLRVSNSSGYAGSLDLSLTA